MTPVAVSFVSTLEAIRAKLPEKLQHPQIGIICGSGLSGLVGALREVNTVPYEDIPGFGTSTGMSADSERNLVVGGASGS